jgi:hypothetical protein
MIKKLLMTGLLILTLSQTVFPQGVFVPSILRLTDDSDHNRLLLIKSDGTYLMVFGVDALRVESFGALTVKGCSLSLQETTEQYRVVVTGDICNRTGKAVLQLYGVGVFTILDRTQN